MVLIASIAGVWPVAISTDAAHAASCSGSLIESIPINHGGRWDQIGSGVTLGYLRIYYNSSNGQNCARTDSSSLTYGKSKEMTVLLRRCTAYRPQQICYTSAEVKDGPARWQYYAGPVSLAAPNNCIYAYGKIEYGWYAGSTSVAATHDGMQATHCG